MMMIWLIRRCRSSGRGDPHAQLSDRAHQHTCHQSTNGPCSVSAPVLHPVPCPPEIMYSSFPASSHPNLFPFLLSICVHPVGSEHLDLLSSCWADTDPSGLVKGGMLGRGGSVQILFLHNWNNTHWFFFSPPKSWAANCKTLSHESCKADYYLLAM